MQTNQLSLRNGFIALIIAYPVLTGLAVFYGDHYGRAVIPLYITTLTVVAPAYKLTAIEIRPSRNEQVLLAEFVTEEPHIVKGGVLHAGIPIEASTLLGHALQHAIVMYTLVVVWLALSRCPLARWLAAAAASLPMLGLLEVLDVPFVLAGSVEDLLASGMHPNDPLMRPMVYWMNFLTGGGRLALAVVGGVLTISIAALTMPCTRSSVVGLPQGGSDL